MLLGAQVELEARGDRAQLAQRPRLELSHALAGNAEVGPDLFERLGRLAVEPEAARQDMSSGSELASRTRLRPWSLAR